MAESKSGKPRKITLIESDDEPDVVRRKMPDANLVEVEMFVRKPDSLEETDFAVAARLCSCRRVCLAFVELE